MPIPLISKVKPTGSFPAVEDVDFQGGFQVRADATDRNAIPAANRKQGTFVFTQSDGAFWSLYNGLTNADWTQLFTIAQLGALAGTSGTPSASNKFVTNADGRLPTTSQALALAGTDGTPGGTNKYVTDSDARNTNKRGPTIAGETNGDLMYYSSFLNAWVPVHLGSNDNVLRSNGAFPFYDRDTLMAGAHITNVGTAARSFNVVGVTVASTGVYNVEIGVRLAGQNYVILPAIATTFGQVLVTNVVDTDPTTILEFTRKDSSGTLATEEFEFAVLYTRSAS